MDHLHTSHRLLLLLLFLFFSRRLLVQFFFHRHSRARGESDHRTKVFSGDFRLHAPPLFLGVFYILSLALTGAAFAKNNPQGNDGC